MAQPRRDPQALATLPIASMSSHEISAFWVLEDTSGYQERAAEVHKGSAPIALRLYRVKGSQAELVGETAYVPKSEKRSREVKGPLALGLVKQARIRPGGVIAVGSRLARGTALLDGLTEQGLEYVVALTSADGEEQFTGTPERKDILRSRLTAAKWNPSKISAPDSSAIYQVAELGQVTQRGMRGARCVALSAGGISDYRRGLIVGATSLSSCYTSEQVARLLGWTRWIRFVSRRTRRVEAVAGLPLASSFVGKPDATSRLITDLTARVNLKIARKLDRAAAAEELGGLWDSAGSLKGRLAAGKQRLNVIELFAGAGGMGLGFLMAGGLERRYRVLFSGEIDPVYATTLKINHHFLRRGKYVEQDDVPEDTHAADLRSSSAMERAQAAAESYGGVDIVIGGPPCQGFSNANRNSYSSKNPNNKLVDTYVDYVVRLRPRVFIMENVQGILWTPRHDTHEQLSVAQHVASRFAAAGYRLFPKLVDAAWFGVPQHRNRFFLLGVHSDLGYAQDEFGEWGPYPRPTHGPTGSRPFTTVRQAIEDLPAIENGEAREEMPYVGVEGDENVFLAQMRTWAPEDRIWDHVTSRHAEYVLERYNEIPEGGNWSSIAHMMTNYADVKRTHSNIYHRLKWAEPSITIGHYRKAMLIHPAQNRGLSLREASRLQSFPDWFRFAGSENGVEGGLTHKQQQLGNAVCPLVTKAVAEHLLKL